MPDDPTEKLVDHSLVGLLFGVENTLPTDPKHLLFRQERRGCLTSSEMLDGSRSGSGLRNAQ
jgi:hypothetical protein